MDNFGVPVDNLWITLSFCSLIVDTVDKSASYPQTYPQVIHNLKVFKKLEGAQFMAFVMCFGKLSTAPTTTTTIYIYIR